MTQPLTTPSGVPQSTPTPRYPDGSPKPASEVAKDREKMTAEEVVEAIFQPGHTVTVTDDPSA